MKIKYLLFLAFIVHSFILIPVFAQEEREEGVFLPTVMGPSPEVAALAKYVEMPVNHSTGVPQIEVPIHSVTEGVIDLPISLSYYAGGIRVAEEATSVGLGWSLMAGGVVSRMIKGKPDDLLGGYMLNDFSVNKVDDLNRYALADYFETTDTEPDVFFFNFSGYSGQFQFIKDTNGLGYFKTLKESNLIIEYDIMHQGHGIERFVITTPDGTKYYFGSYDNNRRAVEEPLLSTYYHSPLKVLQETQFGITAWNLLKIESFTGDVIELHYNFQTETFSVLESQNKLHKYPQPTIIESECDFQPNLDFSIISSTISVNTIIRPRLEYINSTYDSIQFKYDLSHKREDLHGSYPLQKIIVFNRKSRVKVKEFELTHDYFLPIANEQQNYSNIPYSDYRKKRLKLISLIERGFKNNIAKELPPYIFDYNEEKLPHKFSFAQDYWGFYNGKHENRHLLPHIMIDNTVLHHNHGNAERSVNPTKSQAATLNKITYPTGGYTLYEFENNKVATFNRPDAQRYSLRNVITPRTKSFLKIRQNEHPILPNSYTYTFEIKENIVGPVSFETFVTGEGCGELLTNFACDFFFSIKGLNNDYSSGIYSSRSFSQNLDPGIYEITAKGNFSGNPYVATIDFHVEINWEEEDVETVGSPYEFASGGLRVKAIEKYDRQNFLLLKKSYEYTRKTTQSEKNTSGLSLISSGNMAWWPQHHYSEYAYTSTTCSTLNHTLITSNSHKPLFSYNGSSVMYEKVIEYTDNVKDVLGSVNSFKTEYFFDFVMGISSPGSSDLGILQGEMYSEPLRGNLIEKRYYEKIANTHKLLFKETYTYENIFDYYTDFGVLVLPGKESGPMGGFCESKHNENLIITCTAPLVNYAAYDQRSVIHRLKNTSRTEYFSTGEITQTTNYTYQNNPILVSHEKTTYYENGSNLKTVEVDYTYPFDMSADAQMQNLIDENRIEKPIKITNKINGVKTRTVNTIYRTDRSTYNKTLPSILQVGKGGDQSLENRIHYEVYGPKANILQVSKDSNTRVSYIWGYHHRYPVVKLENINYDSIPFSLIDAIENASNNTSETQLRNAINSLRTNATLANAMLTAYIYSPLIGIAQIIDPKGDVLFYNYDAFGRLESIKDKQNNIIEEYEYHYSGNN